MLPLEAANGCAINNISNVGLGLEDVRTSGSSSLMFGNLTFEDAHPAYWGRRMMGIGGFASNTPRVHLFSAARLPDPAK
jgi:hypothetical protein